MTKEQKRYLDEGLNHRRRYYGAELGCGSDSLTLALCWWARWWKERADRVDNDRVRRETADLFDDAT